MNPTIQQDLNEFVNFFTLGKELSNSTFLITGATGLIGKSLIRCLSALDKDIKIYAPVRNLEKAKKISGSYPDVFLFEGDLECFDYSQFPQIDYIIHGAAPTASKYFLENPVETINTIVSASNHLLEFAADSKVKSFVFLSSLEVYGQILEKKKISEDMQGSVDITDIRSAYPLAKRLAENLCCAYYKEYNVPVKIARLTQTTGPGISKDDNRVFAQFIRCAVENRDIILHTDGLSARSYCYLTDAVAAILFILLKGNDAEAYNVANEDCYLSAKDLAYKINELINPNIKIKIEIQDDMGYAPTSYIDLSTEKIRSLGWYPRYSLDSIIHNLANYLKKIYTHHGQTIKYFTCRPD